MDFAGFGLRGFRSFGDIEAIERVGPMQKIHLVVGRNNVGKSNILRFVHNTVAPLRVFKSSPKDLYPGALDTPDGWPEDAVRIVSLGFNRTQATEQAFGLDAKGAGLAPYLETDAYNCGFPGTIWLDFEVIRRANESRWVLAPSYSQFQQAQHELPPNRTRQSLSALSNAMTSGYSSSDVVNLQNVFAKLKFWELLPTTSWVDAVREISALTESTQASGLQNGRGLIAELAKLQTPDYQDYDASSAKFAALQRFVQAVLDDSAARIEVPRGEQSILVHTRSGAVKPLHALGTGIGEVIILAAVATQHIDTLICIEEPEVHLHPALQRLLIEYLDRETENRYLISTHSAALLDAERASISHAAKEVRWTSVQPVGSAAHLSHAVSDLGNRASDLVQSNFVVWVEGPSDRLYVSHWLRKLDPELLEGAHYSIMFYGGSLLNHLSADDEEANELIDLLRINRNPAMVIDSDRRKVDDDLNETKRRVIAELERKSAQAWVTHGYTIENYVPGDVIDDIIVDKYPKKRYVRPKGSTRSPLGAKFQDSDSKPSKVTVAREVISRDLDVASWPAELLSEVDLLSQNIRAANGLKPATFGTAPGFVDSLT